jgi:hypothetical protein
MKLRAFKFKESIDRIDKELSNIYLTRIVLKKLEEDKSSSHAR